MTWVPARISTVIRFRPCIRGFQEMEEHSQEIPALQAQGYVYHLPVKLGWL